MLDRFQHGDIERISPEAPVPVIRLRHTREMPGGAGNVACNVAALGGRALLVGVVGEDEAGARLRRLLAAQPRITDALVGSPHRPTICKTRFIAGRQQVVRADDESIDTLFDDEERALMTAFDAYLEHAQAVVLSDYGKSALSAAVLAHAIGMSRARKIPVFVDPKSEDFARYRGVDCITPNLKEFAAAARAPAGTEAQIAAAAAPLLEQADAQAILVTPLRAGNDAGRAQRRRILGTRPRPRGVRRVRRRRYGDRHPGLGPGERALARPGDAHRQCGGRSRGQQARHGDG